MGLFKKIRKTARNVTKEAKAVGRSVGNIARDPANLATFGATGLFGAGLPGLANEAKRLATPEMPGAETAGITKQDTGLMRSLAEDAARRRRGLAGRSLLRSSFQPLLGRAGTANAVLGK